MILLCLFLPAMLLTVDCAHDPYTERLETFEEHAQSFRNHLKADRVELAIQDNVRIEALAAELSLAISKRSEQAPLSEDDEDRILLRIATRTAALNWLALGRHFTATQRYEQARITYKRVLETYTGPRYREFRDQALEGLHDLELLQAGPGARPPLSSTTTPSPPVVQ